MYLFKHLSSVYYTRVNFSVALQKMTIPMDR